MNTLTTRTRRLICHFEPVRVNLMKQRKGKNNKKNSFFSVCVCCYFYCYFAFNFCHNKRKTRSRERAAFKCDKGVNNFASSGCGGGAWWWIKILKKKEKIVKEKTYRSTPTNDNNTNTNTKKNQGKGSDSVKGSHCRWPNHGGWALFCSSLPLFYIVVLQLLHTRATVEVKPNELFPLLFSFPPTAPLCGLG